MVRLAGSRVQLTLDNLDHFVFGIDHALRVGVADVEDAIGVRRLGQCDVILFHPGLAVGD